MVENEALEDVERTRGILNKREREYLLGQSNIERRTQEERAIRATIRGHLRNAFLDFYILFEHLEERDLNQVFDEQAEEADAFYAGMIHALALILRGTRGNESHWFDILLSSAVWTSAPEPTTEALFQYSTTFEIDRPEPVDVKAIRGKIKWNNWHELTDEELRFMILIGKKANMPMDELLRPDTFEEVVELLTEEGELSMPGD